MDSELVAESLKSVADKLRAVVMNHVLWHGKAIYDMVFDEAYHIRCFEFLSRNDL